VGALFDLGEMHPDPLIHPFGFWRADLNFFCLCIRRAIIKIVTGLSNGQICVLYSPTSSLNGAKLPLSKGPPRKVTIEDMSDDLAQLAIITPHALPMFREGEIVQGTGMKKREKEKLDPRKSRRPQGREGWSECDATRCAKPGEGYDEGGGCTWRFLSSPSAVE
jgi:hypothetical protein